LIFFSFSFSSFPLFTLFVGNIQGAQKWGTDEVVAWLEREGLHTLCSIANEQGLDGSVLLALHKVCTDPAAYKSDCSDLGIPAGAIQLKLKGKLVTLFG